MSEYLEEFDPKLKELAEKIRKLAQEHKVAVCFQLASSTHAEFGMEMPDWSAVKLVPEGFRIKSSAERDGRKHLESSMHLLLSMRDCCTMQAGYLIKYGEAAEKVLKENGVDMEHKTLFERSDNDKPAGEGH